MLGPPSISPGPPALARDPTTALVVDHTFHRFSQISGQRLGAFRRCWRNPRAMATAFVEQRRDHIAAHLIGFTGDRIQQTLVVIAQ